MACPDELDELTLDLWLAGALPADEADRVAAHVPTCAACSTAQQASRGFDSQLRAGLVLDADERAYLGGLKLTSAWQPAHAIPSAPWGWLALFGVLAAFTAWILAGPFLAQGLGFAAQLGVTSILLRTALNAVFGVGQALFDITRNPMLGVYQPLLALLALALLAWPRYRTPQRSL